MIGVYANPTAEKAAEICAEVCSKLSSENIAFVQLKKAIPDGLSLVLVLGGDGTVLGIAEAAARKGVPVLALNAGGTGFLSCFERDEVGECVEFIKRGGFDTELRPLICAEIGGNEFFALNDFCVQRTADAVNNACTLSVSLRISGEFADRFRADGIIVATPTGSTAYSLSAGGAILTPSLNAMIATPLCAHTLRSKPIVFSDTAEAVITVEGRTKGNLYADGRFVAEIPVGCALRIKRSGLNVKFVKGKRSFYEKLSRKLTLWSEK